MLERCLRRDWDQAILGLGGAEAHVSVLRDLLATHALITTEDADAFLGSRGTFSRARETVRWRHSVPMAIWCVSSAGSTHAPTRVLLSGSLPRGITTRARRGPGSVLRARGARRHSPHHQPMCLLHPARRDRPRPVWRGIRMLRISHPVPLTRAGKEFMETELVTAPGAAGCASRPSSAPSST